MGFSGGGLMTVAAIYRGINNINDSLVLFLSSFLMSLIAVCGFMLAHKALTNEWL